MALTREQRQGAMIIAFDNSQFMAAEKVPRAWPCDLPREIHPLFKKFRFSADFDWSVIEPSARLATKLLLSPALNRFHKTWQFGTLDDQQQQYNETRRTGDGNLKLTEAQAEAIQDELNMLGPMVRYELDEEIDHYGTVCNGLTDPANWPNGEGSTISIEADLYWELEHALDQDPFLQDMPFIRYRQFDLAVGMVHEAMHALMNAKYGSAQTWEPYFGGTAAVAEVGYVAEDRLFGGRFGLLFEGDDKERYEIQSAWTKPDDPVAPRTRRKAAERRIEKQRSRDTKHSALSGAFVLFEQPERSMPLHYRRLGLTIGVRRDRLPTYDMAWSVPLEFIGQLFTTAFWAEADRKPELLRPERDVGYFLKADPKSDEGLTYNPQRPTKAKIPRGYDMVNVNFDYTIIKKNVDRVS